ncbi:MAG: 16S rRNA (uracil(1498)-N(3))-methyltransferase [Pelagibacterales bacterium]|nr:16S rRNA (uracil(1498)-N(3))-methyltransferase [Pelagibacterales bacterium]
MSKTRLFVKENPLKCGHILKIEDSDFEYLTKVLRKKKGDIIHVFNGYDGEFCGEINEISKKYLSLVLTTQTSLLKKVKNITLAFAPVKNVRIDFVAAKATELGVANFQPLITKRTIVDKINEERFIANIKEACEQCERNDFPKLNKIKKLESFFAEEEIGKKILILCDESGKGNQAKEILPQILLNKKEDIEIVILIGPEGGFAPEEFAKMQVLGNLHSLNLGPRILRADTAIISSLTLVQEFLGDFNLKPKF